jgi:hypothetical protein
VEGFLARLEAAGDELLRDELPAGALERAEGQRYLLQRLSATIDAALDAESGPPVAATVPKWFGPSLDDRARRVNVLRPPAKSASEGLRENAYGSGWFQLGLGGVLLIELYEPTAHLWSFELGTFWWQSIDYVNHTSSINGFQAVMSSDGR